MAPQSEQPQRLRLADEAARILLEEGGRDFARAKRKALQHLGLDAREEWPTNAEIEAAMLARSRLFATAADREEWLARLRAAQQVMERLAQFQPRLVGPLIQGLVEPEAIVNLHGFADTPEEVIIALGDRGVQCKTGERRYRASGGGTPRPPVPYLSFRGPEGIEIQLTVFPIDGLRQAPPSPVDGKPMRRLPVAAVRELIAEGEKKLFGED